MRDNKNIDKIEDTELENVSGGMIIMNDLVHREGENNVNPQNAIMSGDTNVDPLLLGGKNAGVAGNRPPEVGKVTGRDKGLLNTGGQWA